MVYFGEGTTSSTIVIQGDIYPGLGTAERPISLDREDRDLDTPAFSFNSTHKEQEKEKEYAKKYQEGLH